MRFDDAPADGLDVHHAGVVGEIGADPGAAIALETAPLARLDDPVIECAAGAGDAARMPAPRRLALHHRPVAADVVAGQQLHPKMPRPAILEKTALRLENARSRTHSFQIGDRLAEDRIARRRGIVQTAFEALRSRDPEPVVDPAVAGIELVAVHIVGRNVYVARTVDVGEILLTPGIAFVDGHRGSSV